MHWQIKEKASKEKTQNLVDQLGVTSLVAQLLVQREVETFDQAKSYFRPNIESLHDPFLMKGMNLAVDRLIDAISNNQRILVYGDYDVDGSTSVAMFYYFLTQQYKNVEYYIPDRYLEGYGVSDASIDYAIKNNFELVITIDCGIKAVDKVTRAKESGVDFIICDHHTPGATIPDAVAVLDPKQTDCNYPFDELCGCGVAFKLIQAFCIQNGIDDEVWVSLLEFVAIATSCDIVPMVGENRTLTYFGLKQLNSSSRAGIKSMIELTGYSIPLNVTNVVFGIGPRINAAGRIDHAHGAVKLLLAKTDEEAQQLGKQVNRLNDERRELDKAITLEALSMIESQEDYENLYSSVLFKDDWHKGVIGIVASRCIEKHYKPTIIFSESNGKLTGSARSVSGFDIYNAINRCSDLLLQFGGHKYAAGLALEKSNLEAFQNKFESVVAEDILPHQRIPFINVDAEIKPTDINESLQRILAQMEPFGPQNMRPVFAILNAESLEGSVRILKQDHLKFKIKTEDNQGIDAIAFGMADKEVLVGQGEFKLCFTIELNTYRGISAIQLMVRDIQPIALIAQV